MQMRAPAFVRRLGAKKGAVGVECASVVGGGAAVMTGERREWERVLEHHRQPKSMRQGCLVRWWWCLPVVGGGSVVVGVSTRVGGGEMRCGSGTAATQARCATRGRYAGTYTIASTGVVGVGASASASTSASASVRRDHGDGHYHWHSWGHRHAQTKGVQRSWGNMVSTTAAAATTTTTTTTIIIIIIIVIIITVARTGGTIRAQHVHKGPKAWRRWLDTARRGATAAACVAGGQRRG